MPKYKLNFGLSTTIVEATGKDDIDNLLTTCLSGREVSVTQL